MVKIGAKPGHDERGRAAGTGAHRRATVGIFGQLYLVVFLHARQHLGFDVFGEHAGHRVIFLATLVSLGVAATVGDHDEDHRRNTLLGDQVVEDARQFHAGPPSGTVVDDHERRFTVRLVLRWNVNSDLPLVVDVVSLDDQRLGV